ncbi:hypothetical protein BO70DRAFT_382974 [Aspergillus heteromorphus CBS 117.55]|uniref:DUF1308 domain-containing protein n=1 Tax=Aspergillus heteromorphus CBS 117.55 TaxID=1448321 RepID=A0A317UYM3_9EURO|nr:uncharacterized protein BO70DRAFT_382974 [Aspergillus heteromorphus CBS 117.55]PWY67163.1 hypothetical protein BO70DRAFT_382974 [Aspergillus heteromorphus CBS 117.55]
MSSNPTDQLQTSQTLATSLVARCRSLLADLGAFQALLAQTQRNPQIVEVRSLRSNALSELRTLERLDAQVRAVNDNDNDNEDSLRLLHALRSSNLPFYEAVWAIARNSCRGLVMFGKRFYWGGGGGEDGAEGKRSARDKRKSVFVDIVAADGEEWVKVSTVSQTRLLFEMAKKGWEGDDSDSDGEGEARTVLRNFDGDEDEDDDDDDQIELIKLAGDLRKAADATRVRYRHPRLRFMIPKIEEGTSVEIDGLLKIIRGYGITVVCGENAYGGTDAQRDLSHLLPQPFKRFTPTLNVDCTLLLAVVSDLSHRKDITQSPIHHRAINRQIEVEHDRPLLPTELWPAMVGHELVCTEEAARRMKEIVTIIGTETENLRMKILMGDAPFAECSTEDLLRKYQELSDYEMPSQWKLPVKAVEAHSVIASARDNGKLPPLCRKVEDILSDINYSVFLYGWAAEVATISSNRTVVKEIEAMVEKHRDGDEDLEGPLIWVCDTARSLIGKEKGRKS